MVLPETVKKRDPPKRVSRIAALPTVAQWIEHSSSKLEVVGSNPTGGAFRPLFINPSCGTEDLTLGPLISQVVLLSLGFNGRRSSKRSNSRVTK